MSTAIAAHSLTKQFGKVTAVDSVSFTMNSGEILGLLGPNGAGKTTTIQMLLGILTPTHGSIEYFGKNLVSHRAEILERINFSSTYTNLPWNLKVRDCLAFLSRLYQLSDRKARVGEIIELFRLSTLLNTPVIALSAGELTRLNLAKAFLNHPDVVLLDEPTASLDPESAHIVREFILTRRKETGMSVLLTSHNMNEVETVCDRVIFIHQGAVIANDTPANLSKTLGRCTISIIVSPNQQASFYECCSQFNVQAQTQDGYSTLSLDERLVSEFLAELNQRTIPPHGITISRATLEDYFLSQAFSKESLDAS